THRVAHHTLGALLERGRADGSFRSDLPVSWLVTTCIAVIHACAGEVREGRIDEGDAVRILTTTIHDLFVGGGQVPGGKGSLARAVQLPKPAGRERGRAPFGRGRPLRKRADDVHPVRRLQEDNLCSQGLVVDPAAGGGHRD